MNITPVPPWSRAHGEPIFPGVIRQESHDFRVTEHLGWEPDGTGEHDYLWVEKIGANTEWIARQLASYAGVPPKDVGYSGLKDRHAITRQWFSVPRWHNLNWDKFALEGVSVLKVARHARKLRRGAHKKIVSSLRFAVMHPLIIYW